MRTAREVRADNCLNLAAQLAFYFFLALFPGAAVPRRAHQLPAGQRAARRRSPRRWRAWRRAMSSASSRSRSSRSRNDENGGLLTLGMLGTIWSMSSGMDAIISTLNQAYDIQESRPWWTVKLTAIGLTLALAVFIVISMALVMVGPTLGEKVAAWFYLGPAFTLAWNILQWPVVFGLVTLAIAIIYYYAPDAEQEWIWITPGSVLATVLWLLISHRLQVLRDELRVL